MDRNIYFRNILYKAKYILEGPITKIELDDCRLELLMMGENSHRACWGLASDWASADDLLLVKGVIENVLREPINDEVELFLLGNEALKAIRFIKGPLFIHEYIARILRVHCENAVDMHITAISTCNEYSVDQVKPTILDEFHYFIETDENDIRREMTFECLKIWLKNNEIAYNWDNMKELIFQFEESFQYKLSCNF